MIIADLNVNHVQWVSEHFTEKIRAVKVCPQPHFPLRDESISLCVGFSVFTHIDANESGWLAEIDRVLSPDGWAFLTIHAEQAWQYYGKNPGWGLQDDERFLSMCDGPMPCDRLVFDYKPGTRFHCCQTFMTTDYIRRIWGRWFNVVGIYDSPNYAHSAVLMRKRRR